MNTQVIDEDSVDPEALQAQIDLSMSFAQNLISSWMEPHKFPKNSRRQNLEQELTEYMKRPPRLGVGASIPEGVQSQTREIARLKGKLTGSKRPREEDNVSASKTPSDEESESRATTVKKKARSDPFDVVHGKKKKKSNDSEASFSQNGSAFSKHNEKQKEKKSDRVAGIQPSNRPLSEGERSPDSSEEVERELSTSCETGVSPAPKAKNKQKSDVTSEMTSASVKAIPPPNWQHPSPSIGKTQKELREIILSSTRSPTSHKSFPAEFSKIPLLNLSGPPSDPESDCDPATPSTSPKKKRKRRKKKKNHSSSLDTATNSGQPLTPTPTTT